MATLNTSIEGTAINRAYRSIVDSPGPASATAAQSQTYAQWAVFSVHAPLANAFQQDSGKESVLKVYRTGEGELEDLLEEFSEGKIQFGFAKVKDPNTTLQKCVLIAWCGQGVPERTKGYFTSHLTTVAKILHGYHVQVTARSTDDLSPADIIKKVSDASGSKYSGGSQPTASSGPAPPVASKPVFTPSRIGGSSSGFNPLGSRARGAPSKELDEDGWEKDAAPVTRSQLERVQPAYKPTKVDMHELTSQKQEPSRFTPATRNGSADQPDLVKGGYQPVGKVDIAALRREAKESSSKTDDRPTAVKGSYEPVGKVDIAAIRARAKPDQGASSPSAPSMSPAQTGTSATSGGADSEPKSLADRSSAFAPAERMSSMPKPRVANKLGGGSFTGTKAPTPGGFDYAPTAPKAAPVGAASKTFADEGGKTPAQIWVEKKARQRGDSGAGETSRPAATISSQASGTGAWESGYSGKKWGAVQTTRTGQSSGGVSQQKTGDEDQRDEDVPSSRGVGALRDQFKGAAPMGAAMTGDRDEEDSTSSPPPPMDMSSKPSASRGVPMPGLPNRGGHPEEEQVAVPPPPAIPRTPSPEEDEPEMRPSSPIRIAQPVARMEEKPLERAEEPALMPTKSLDRAIPNEQDLDDDETDNDPARTAGHTAAESQFGAPAVDKAAAGVGSREAGKRALIQYDYEKAEDNELALVEGEYVTNIEMVDEDWWMGQNSRGESGLFPSNYVELQEDGDEAGPEPSRAPEPKAVAAERPAPAPEAAPAGAGKSAVAQYDYEAAEDNELSFPEGATITNVEFPDEDWWLGEYKGKQGLFPANYVELS